MSNLILLLSDFFMFLFKGDPYCRNQNFSTLVCDKFPFATIISGEGFLIFGNIST